MRIFIANEVNEVIVNKLIEIDQSVSKKKKFPYRYRWISVNDKDDKAQPIVGEE